MLGSRSVPHNRLAVEDGTGGRHLGAMTVFRGMVEGARVLLVDAYVVAGPWRQFYVLRSRLHVRPQVDVIEASRLRGAISRLVLARRRRFLPTLRLYRAECINSR